MEYKLVIQGIMPNLNDYLQGERITIRKNGKFTTKGNELKQKYQNVVIANVRKQLLGGRGTFADKRLLRLYRSRGSCGILRY